MKASKKITLLEQAITQVPGFAEINNKLERKVKLNSLSRSTYYNYARSIAKVSLHFKRTPGKFLFPVKAMSLIFRAKFVHLLRKKTNAGKINADQTLFDQLFKKNWIVFAKQPFLGPAQIIEYIGRYTHKIAISNHRIIKVDQQKVFFSYKDYRKEGKNKIMALDKMEFIRRFSLHILPLRFVRIRHYGILNARSKHKTTDIVHAIHQSGVTEKQNNQTSHFLTPITNNTQTCPVCKRGKMLIVAFGNSRDPPPDIDALSKGRLFI